MIVKQFLINNLKFPEENITMMLDDTIPKYNESDFVPTKANMIEQMTKLFSKKNK